MHNFNNKQVLISGGSSGIGLALAKQLAQCGASVCILARRVDVLRSAQTEIESYCINSDQKVATVTADVSNYQATHLALTEWMQNQGVPDLVINSAGVVLPGEFEQLDLDTFHWMMDINFFGTLHVIKTVLPSMLSRGNGHIVNVASAAAFLSIYGYTAYSASKYAVRGFTDALRSEMKRRGITVSLVMPSDTRTPQLEYESQRRPQITRIIAETNGIMTPEKVAGEIISSIAHRRYLILPGIETKLTYLLSSWLGRLIYPLMDWMIASAARKSSIKKE